jgi:hypothetical protein
MLLKFGLIIWILLNCIITIEDYHRLAGENQKIADLLAMPGIEDAVLEIPKLQDLAGPADLS